MTIKEARHNQGMVNSLFDSFIKMIDGYLISDMQRKELLNAKMTISNIFDIDVNHSLKMLKIEKAISENSFKK